MFNNLNPAQQAKAIELLRNACDDKFFSQTGYAAVYEKNGEIFSTDNAKDTVGGEILVETRDFKYDWRLSDIEEMPDEQVVAEFFKG